MKNSIGTQVILTIFGESHGPMIGAVLDGLAPGIRVDEEFITSQLSKRRPQGATDTARVEEDHFTIASGVFNGYTTGAPLCILIPNENVRSADYEKTAMLARPSHADYAAHIRYQGFEDWRGGGHFSGRITAAIVAAGAVALQALESKGIKIATHILQCGTVQDVEFTDFPTQLDLVNSRAFPVIDNVEQAMTDVILNARSNNDSVGGKVQTAITGIMPGIGEPWFDSLEGVISKAMFAIGGVKGIEFGRGFGFASSYGSQANDQLFNDKGSVKTVTNNNGGINGGLSNGMPILFNLAVKPTPSIAKEQRTVNLETGQDAVLELHGRHDPAIIRRICIVVTSLTAIVMCDMLSLRFGNDWLSPQHK
ncbi:MAG: chorismate synthase [Bacteroidaceae bacterium]|nr:chorismate synthase [Bacteroidaceae bacterium]